MADHLHGQRVADPYRWLEEMESKETGLWVAAQEALFRGYVRSYPARAEIARRVEALSRFENLNVPKRARGGHLYMRSAPGASAVLRLRDSTGEERVVVDTATHALFAQGARLGGWSVSPDGGTLVVGLRAGTGRIVVLRFVDIESGAVLPDTITDVTGTPRAWVSDGRGFFYVRYDRETTDEGVERVLSPRVAYHRMGSAQGEDRTIIAFPDHPDRFLGRPALSTDDRHLVVGTSDKKHSLKRTFHIDLLDPARPLQELFSTTEPTSFIDAEEGRLLFNTDHGAEQGRIVAMPPRPTAPADWVDVIPEQPHRLYAVWATRTRIFTLYLVDALQRFYTFDRSGGDRKEARQAILGAGGIGTSPHSDEVFYFLANLFTPGSIWRVDAATGKTALWRRREVVHDPETFVMRQVFCESADGTRVPMLLAHRKDLDLDEPHPVWMYGYGHAGWAAFPWYQPHLVHWLERGGIYALPGIRGGAEYGRRWELAGMRRNKVNGIADFEGAARWLIRRGLTKPHMLVANGGSASGHLPAAALIRSPELFGAAVMDWPFLDMIRYPRFAQGFVTGFGDPEIEEDFAVLRSYSPYHNLVERSWPPMLVTVAEHDVSTAPLHGYKFVAKAQHVQQGPAPVMLQMIRGVGHYSFGKTASQARANQVDQLVFVLKALGL